LSEGGISWLSLPRSAPLPRGETGYGIGFSVTAVGAGRVRTPHASAGPRGRQNLSHTPLPFRSPRRLAAARRGWGRVEIPACTCRSFSRSPGRKWIIAVRRKTRRSVRPPWRTSDFEAFSALYVGHGGPTLRLRRTDRTGSNYFRGSVLEKTKRYIQRNGLDNPINRDYTSGNIIGCAGLHPGPCEDRGEFLTPA
jgi:hypothetical protein